MTGKMQKQNIVGAALGQEILNLRLCNVRGPVIHNIYSEVSDLRITEHRAQGYSIGRRGQQMP